MKGDGIEAIQCSKFSQVHSVSPLERRHAWGEGTHGKSGGERGAGAGDSRSDLAGDDIEATSYGRLDRGDGGGAQHVEELECRLAIINRV